MRRWRFRLRLGVQHVVSKEDPRGEMSVRFSETNANDAVKKLFLYILLIRVLQFTAVHVGGRMIGMDLNMA